METQKIYTMRKTAIKLAAVAVFLGISLFSGKVSAQQEGAGPDTMVCKGGSVVLGSGTEQAGFCYYWVPQTGLDNPRSLHPTCTPTQTTTYTLYVQGPNFGPPNLSDQVTISVLEIKDVVFNPDPLPATGTATTQASATITPGGRTIAWAIEGNNRGCTINQSTGLITSGTEGGTITVRAYDAALFQQSIQCFAEGSLCLGDGSECCGPINASRTFGPITISIPGGPYQPTGDPDAQGYCPYTVQAGLALDMLGVFQKSASITGATVSWKEKVANKSFQYKEVSINWTGTLALGPFGVIDANLTEVGLTVNANGELSGSLTFNVNLNQDVKIGEIAYLKEGLTGDFTYTYNNSNGWTGAWDFSDITGFEVDLIKNGSPIARISAGSFDNNGVVHDATFAVVTPATWTSNSFTATLTECSLTADFNIANSQIDFKSGTGEIELTNVTGVEGDITLGLAFSPTNVTVTVGLQNGKAFGCTISGQLSTTMTYAFDIEEIAGSNISAKHDEFDQSFTNVNFKIADGEVEEFSFGQIQVKYKNKISFSMANASYTKASGKLTLDAKVELPALQLQVEQFSIAHNGSVTVTKIIGDINKTPVEVHIDLAFQTNEFSGTITGTFAGGVGMNLNVVVGATASFNYGHFAISIAIGPGIPLGNSGLKVKTLAGEFGYNWAAPTLGGGTGGPQQGTTTIGFGLGISDMANICLLEGYVRMILGNSNTMQLEGAVKVTANAPHYFEGTMMVEYTFGAGAVNGQLNSNIKFPAGSGDVVNLNTGNIAFQIATSKWSVNAPGLTGKVFNQIDLTGNLNIWAYLGSSGSVNGTINGAMSYDYNWSYAYPSGFDPSSCSSADATDTWYGFGIAGSLALHLGGTLNAQMNSNGIVGSISAESTANCVMTVKWPCFLTCGYACIASYNVYLEGNLTVEKQTSAMRVHGNVVFKYGNEAENAEIDITI
jgi:hypothetical protein